MRKVAVYVEGMTELVFVYHCIQAYYQSDWTAFHLDYVSVSPSDRIGLVNPYGDEAAENQFLLYNCGSDDSVISTMKVRFQAHLQQGYDRIIGLQDVFGTRYFDVYKAGHQQIEWDKVGAMIKDLEATVSGLDPSGAMKIRFSIMEIEAWILGMPDLLAECFPGCPHDELLTVNPEFSFVHPFNKLASLVPYSKSFSTVEGIFSRITKNHLVALLQSGRCASFARFYDCLFN